MKLTPGLKEYSILINEHQIHFSCKYNSKSSEVIIFFHGLGCSWDSFRNVLDHDYFPNKSLLFLDHIGFGNSSKTEDFSYTMENQAQIIERLLSILPQWNIHIVAHSMGVAIALFLEPQTFSRVISFSNIEGNLISEDCGIMSRGISDISFKEYKNKLYKLHIFVYRGNDQLHFEQSSPFAIYNSAVSLVKKSDSGELLLRFRKLSCNKSYFYGEENKDMTVLKKLDFVQKYMIQNSGHGMTTENPKEFYTKLVEFVNSGFNNPRLF